MVPAAARRAHLVQRNYFQGLQGNPDACHPRRGSACNGTARKTGGKARLASALFVQLTAANSPRTGGSRVGEAPRPFFSPISSGRNGGARRVGAPCGGHPGRQWAGQVSGPYGNPPIRHVGAAALGGPPHGGHPRCENVEPLIRPSVRTGAPFPHRGEGFGRMVSAPTGPPWRRPGGGRNRPARPGVPVHPRSGRPGCPARWRP